MFAELPIRDAEVPNAGDANLLDFIFGGSPNLAKNLIAWNLAGLKDSISLITLPRRTQ
jgi:hypothetical protein